MFIRSCTSVSSGTYKYIGARRTRGTWRKFPLVPANRFRVQFGKEIGFPITMRRWLSCDCHLTDLCARDGAKEANARERPRVFPVSRNCYRRAILRWKLVKYFQRDFSDYHRFVIVSLLRTNYRFAVSNGSGFTIEWAIHFDFIHISCIPCRL